MLDFFSVENIIFVNNDNKYKVKDDIQNMIKFIITKINKYNKNFYLSWACKYGHITIVKYIIKRFHLTNSVNNTDLFLAAYVNDHSDIVRLLLNHDLITIDQIKNYYYNIHELDIYNNKNHRFVITKQNIKKISGHNVFFFREHKYIDDNIYDLFFRRDLEYKDVNMVFYYDDTDDYIIENTENDIRRYLKDKIKEFDYKEERRKEWRNVCIELEYKPSFGSTSFHGIVYEKSLNDFNQLCNK